MSNVEGFEPEGVTFVLLDSQNRILMQLRDDGQGKSIPYPNTWVIPGGTTEPGENLMDATVREIREEFNIKIKSSDLSFLTLYRPRVLNSNKEIVGHVFIANLPIGSNPRLGEGADMKWMKVDEIKALDLGFGQGVLIPKLVVYINTKPSETSIRIPVVNSNDNLIGYKPRNLIKTDDIYRVSALWLLDSQSQILLTKRSLDKKHDPGKWQVAVAGTVEEQETYKENLVKEAQEELGLRSLTLAEGPKTFEKGEWNFFCQWFFARLDWPAAELEYNRDEIAEISWFTVDQLEQLLRTQPTQFLPAVEKILKIYKQYI